MTKRRTQYSVTFRNDFICYLYYLYTFSKKFAYIHKGIKVYFKLTFIIYFFTRTKTNFKNWKQIIKNYWNFLYAFLSIFMCCVIKSNIQYSTTGLRIILHFSSICLHVLMKNTTIFFFKIQCTRGNIIRDMKFNVNLLNNSNLLLFLSGRRTSDVNTDARKLIFRDKFWIFQIMVFGVVAKVLN